MSELSSIEDEYQQFHTTLLTDFIHLAQQQPPFCVDECETDDAEFIQRLKTLPTLQGEQFNIQGQTLLCKIVSAYSHLMPLLSRDLLWFFGGDCLQFMPDDEISHFQKLDEKRHEAAALGEQFSYKDERAKQLGLH